MELEKLKLYKVTKGSSDHTYRKGDIIWLSNNDALNSCQGAGWLSKDEWDTAGTNDFEVEECKDYYLDVSGGHEAVRRKMV